EGRMGGRGGGGEGILSWRVAGEPATAREFAGDLVEGDRARAPEGAQRVGQRSGAERGLPHDVHDLPMAAGEVLFRQGPLGGLVDEPVQVLEPVADGPLLQVPVTYPSYARKPLSVFDYIIGVRGRQYR